MRYSPDYAGLQGRDLNPAGTLEQYTAVDLVINEIMPNSLNCCTDEHGDVEPFIELLNLGSNPIVVSGMYLSTMQDQTARTIIPVDAVQSAVIQPDSFLVIWMDGQPEQGLQHTGLELSTESSSISLFMYDAETPVNNVAFSPLGADTSFSRSPDGADTWIYANPTPGAPNQSTMDVAVSIVPESFLLHQNYPNPFNPKTIIRFNTVVEMQHAASLQIFDITGKVVETLFDDQIKPGIHEISWDASNHPSGVYFAVLQNGHLQQTRKLVYLK